MNSKFFLLAGILAFIWALVSPASCWSTKYDLTCPKGQLVLESVQVGSAECFNPISLADQIGATVKWEPSLERLEITNAAGDKVVLIAGFEGYKFNDEIVRLAPPVRFEGQLLINKLTLERISSSLGSPLRWKQEAEGTPASGNEESLTMDEIFKMMSSGTKTPIPLPMDTPNAVAANLKEASNDQDLKKALSSGSVQPNEMAQMIAQASMELASERENRPVRSASLTRIVLDPGHGGDDTGSVGPTELRESDVCLQVCMELKSRLEQGTNLQVSLTRTPEDTAKLPSSVRAARANAVAGQVLISIHCGAGLFPEQTGLLVFYPAASDEGAEGSMDSGRTTRTLRLVPWKEASRPYQEASAALANDLYEKVRIISRPPREDVPRASCLELLQTAEMPSALIEIGAISNPKEESRLRQRGYQKEIAESIYSGIAKFLRERKQDGGE